MSVKEKNSEKKKSNGGSSQFKVDYVEKKPIETEVSEGLAGEEGENIQVSETDTMVSGMLVEASAKMIGKTLELLTKIPEMNFDEEEIEQLKVAWMPLLPTVSPVMAALVITSTIVAGKVAVYATMHKAIKVKGDDFKDVESKPVGEAEE